MLILRKRGSQSVRRWWWALDSLTIALILFIIVIGTLLITTASPSVAEHLKLNPYYFVHRQFVFLMLGCILIFLISSIPEHVLKRFVLVIFIMCLLLMLNVLIFGEGVKGAKRWISILGFSLQPSEIMKPFFIYLTGLILAEKYNRDKFPGFSLCIGLYGIIVFLLILQPDFGMVITYTAVMMGQFFIAGLSLWWIFWGIFLSMGGGIAAYNFFPHVAKRIDSFLDPQTNENYQIEKSLESYVNGGLFGVGPGEGIVKAHLPDSHADFIFAVAGEEFGAIFSSSIMLLFLSLILRSLYLLYKEQNLFKIYAGTGLIMLFTLQTVFNIGVTLHLFPTKGMTLPFISYGGSSTICFAIAFGIFLNFTRKFRSI